MEKCMYKEARVLIVEDDPYARNWMALILARDWHRAAI
jgi:DNA-binding NtrC family response regulator